MKQLSLSERLNQFATDQDDLSRRGEKNLAAEAAQAIDLLTAERDQLAAQVEELKTMQVDAIGDGFFDGYNQAITDSKVLGHDLYSYKEADILRLSEKYESEHRYSKSIADIRAKVLDDLSAELFEIPFVGVSSSFLKERANKIRQAAKGGE